MSQEPLFWYRPRSDGGYEGPLHNGQIEDVRKASGAWVPLFAGAAPVSAEPVAVPKGWRLVPVSPTKEMLLAGETEEYDAELWWSLMLDAAPTTPVATPAPAFSVGVRGVGIIDDNPSALAVYFNAAPNDDDIRALHEIVTNAPISAQPDITQQTLDDVKAGIPARDAEIAALRKEIETLRAQQPVSGADGVSASPTQGMTLGQRIAHVGGRENAQGYVEFGSPMAVNALIQHVLRDFHRQGRVNLAPAQLSGNTGQPDHLPDATKMVEPSVSSGEFEKFAGRKLMEAYKAGMHGKNFNIPEAVDSITRASMDQFRDAAQMIEPSGNSGELEPVADHLFAAAYQAGMDGDEFDTIHAKKLLTRAALAQQDATRADVDIEAAAKVFAERVGCLWEPMPEQGREVMRKCTKDIIDAARKEQA